MSTHNEIDEAIDPTPPPRLTGSFISMVSLDHEAVEPAKLRIQDCSLLLDSQAYLLSSLRWLFEGLNWRASSLVKFEPHIDEIGAPISRT